ERQKMAAAQEEIGLGATGLIDPSTAPQLGREVGANKVIVGSFAIVSGVVQISARMVDVETNTIVGGVAAAAAIGGLAAAEMLPGQGGGKPSASR
nr:hypothetical protein [Acidobacteriota bacterium]